MKVSITSVSYTHLDVYKRQVSDTFLLSGYYTDYIPMRTNNRGYVYVSSAFKEDVYKRQEGTTGYAGDRHDQGEH